MPHTTTSYQPYELMLGHKAPTICDAWLGLANYNDNFSSVHGWINSMNSSLLDIGGYWKELNIVQKDQSPGHEEKLSIFHLIICCYFMTIWEVVIRSKTITNVNCLSWNQNTRIQMCIPSNHLMVRFLCIWLTDNSYFTFISHRGILCHLIKPPYQMTYYTAQEISWKSNSPK